MNTFIVLFRGINVGGHNVLPMRELASILKSLGLEDVRTYIQSGNAVFRTSLTDASNLAAKIGEAIAGAKGFRPSLFLLGAEELRRSMVANPFRDAEGDPSKLHLFFLASAPSQVNTEAIERTRAKSERTALAGRVFYLHAPDGIGRSKLAARVETLLGVPTTARNWRTVLKLREMVERSS